MSSPRGTVQRAALLAIGDEVLRGEIGNTNAAFIAERLFEAGIELAEHMVVSDDPQAIRSALVRLRAEVDVVIATGGLGPTEDDRTVDVVADLFGTGTVPDEPSLGAMKKRFSTHGFELTPNNLRQVRMFIDQVAPRLQVRMAEAGVPRAAVRTWHVYGMGESHIDHRLAGLLNGVENATLHFRTSNPENHVKVVVRDRD